MVIISDGKIVSCTADGKVTPVASGILNKYISTVKESARRTEWKYSGEGAKFTGTYSPHKDADSAAASVASKAVGIGFLPDGTMLYSMYINGASGIYTRPENGGTEGIFISDNEYRYRDIAVNGNRVLVTAEAVGECHVGIIEGDNRYCTFLTEGVSRESSPCWSAVRENCFYYASAGLEEIPAGNAEEMPAGYDDEISLSGMMKKLKAEQQNINRRQGPSGIFRMDLDTYGIDEICADGKYSYISPTEDGDGGLWYIKYPYRYDDSGRKKPGTVLKDILLFPFRLIGGIFGFFDFFTMKYSGKTLNSSAGASKKTAESKKFVLGNLIDAEREIKKNGERGDSFPGYVPADYELCRTQDGHTVTVAKGVCAYALYKGEVYYSNGSYVLKMSAGSKPEKVCRAENVTGIFFR